MRMVKRPQKVPGRSDQEPKSRETPTPLRAYTSGSSPLRAGTNPIQHIFIAHGRAERPTRSMKGGGEGGGDGGGEGGGDGGGGEAFTEFDAACVVELYVERRP